jgi:hypothetical protein
MIATDIFEREVTVCASCLTAACWLAEFICDKWQNSGSAQKTVRQLLNLHLEPPHYWGIDDAEIVRRYNERDREA